MGDYVISLLDRCGVVYQRNKASARHRGVIKAKSREKICFINSPHQ